MTEGRTALITGATGGVGGEVAEALIRHGWRVRALARDLGRARRDGPRGIEWIAGDAMNRADMVAAAEGAAILFHGANPPGYRNWRGLAVPMLAHAICAAEAVGARLIYPGSLYVYGPDAGAVVSEDAPRHPRTRKGAIRVGMEAMLAEAAARGLRTLLVRAGDFFGPRAPSSWVTKLMMNDGAPVRSVRTPEVPGAVHAWAYLPDLGETIARLADREAALPPAARFHFAGHALTGRAMAEAVSRTYDHHPPVRPFPWWQIYLGAPFDTFCREVIEMRYLWTTSLRLDGTRLLAELGEEPRTPLDAALRRTRAALESGGVADAAPTLGATA